MAPTRPPKLIDRFPRLRTTSGRIKWSNCTSNKLSGRTKGRDGAEIDLRRRHNFLFPVPEIRRSKGAAAFHAMAQMGLHEIRHLSQTYPTFDGKHQTSFRL